MRSLISFHEVPLSAIDVPGSSFFWREEKGRRCVQAGPHPAWPQLFEERAVVSGREVRAQDEPHVEWPHAFDARAATAESGRRAVRAQSGREQFPWEQGIDDRATAAGAALRTTAEEMLRAGWAQPAPGRARALRAASILGLLRWLLVEGFRWRFNGSDRRALKTAAVAQRRRRESVKRVARWPRRFLVRGNCYAKTLLRCLASG